MATCYETLGIDPQATADEVDRAYRFLAQKFHPDANPGSPDLARKRFQVVQEAYDILSDHVRRREYDVKLGSGMEADWERITMDTDNGGVRFNSDGSLDVAGRRIGAESGLQKSTLGAATMEKDAGPGGELRIWHNGRSHCFRYVNKNWYAKRDKSSAPKKERPAKTSTERTPRALAPAVPPVYRSSPDPDIVEGLPSRQRHHPRRALLIAGTLLLIGLVGGFYASRSGSMSLALTSEEEIKQKEEELHKRQQLTDLNAKLHEQSAVEDRQRQEIALTKDRLLEAKRRGEGGLAAVDDLDSQLDQWNREVPPLLTNEAGQKLATSADNLRAFKALYEKPRASKPMANGLRTEIEALLAPIHQALATETPGHAGSADFSDRIQVKTEEAEKLASQLRKTRESIQNLVVLTSAVPPSPKTLQQALADMGLDDAQQEAVLIAQTEKTTRDAAAAELANARKLLVETELLREKKAIESQAAAERARLEHEKNLEEAQTTQVQNKLRFFLTEGYYQPDRESYIKTVEPHPISYSRLLSYGALEPTNEGLGRLLYVVTNFPNDLRTKSSLPNYMNGLSPQQTQQLVEMQDYVRRLGDAMVELKLLDP